MRKTAGQVFDEWASDTRAARMADHHWPVVKQGHALIPRSSGGYLEVGVGNGSSLRTVATGQHVAGRCLGIDVSDGMVELARRATSDLANVQVDKADFLDPLAPLRGPFSTIFSMEVFYYFPDIQAGLDRACSLLEPGGRLIVMVDFFAENKSSHSWPEELGTTMSLWSQDEYRRGFERAGLAHVRQHLFVDPASSDPGAVDAATEPEGAGTLCTVGDRPACK